MLVSEFPPLPSGLAIFSPSNRSPRVAAEFWDLKGTKFTSDQQNFISAQLAKQLGDLPDIRFGDSGNKLLKRYNIPEGTALGWAKRFKSPHSINRGSAGGRPHSVDAVGILAMVAAVKAGKAAAAAAGKKVKKGAAKQLFTEKDLVQIAVQQSVLSRIRAGARLDLDSDRNVLHPSTIKSLKKRMKVAVKAGGGTFKGSANVVVETTARFKALGCATMAVQQAVMVEAMMGHLPDEHKWNVDATTCLSEADGTGATQYRIVTEAEAKEYEAKEHAQVFNSANFQGKLGCFVKWMQLCNAVGDFGKTVLIVAAKGMPPGAFHCVKVQGLTNTTDSTQYGYLFFCATRCMKGLTPEQLEAATKKAEEEGLEIPENGWSYYFRLLLAGDIKRFCDEYNLIDPATKQRYPSVITIDGENVVNRELMDTRVWTALDEVHASLIKNRPQCTKYDNPCDASTNFRDLKTGMREVDKKEKDYTNTRLSGNLDAAFKELTDRFGAVVTMSAEQWGKAKGAIQKLVFVCRTKYVTSEKARQGFFAARHARPPGSVLERPIAGRENSTVDFYRIIKDLCYTVTPVAEIDKIMEKANEMIAIFLANGRLTRADMDALGIWKMEDDNNRDDNCLAQQGPVLLTCAETRAREVAYRARKHDNEAEKENEQQDKVAQRLINNEQKKQEKAARDKAAREVEVARKAALSPDAKKAEKDEKRRVVDEKKAQKALALEAAAVRLAGR